MATGIELMFSKMIGLTPDQLSQMAKGFVSSVDNINASLTTIAKQVGEIHAATVGDKNDRQTNDN
jgi:hypothetical protein